MKVGPYLGDLSNELEKYGKNAFVQTFAAAAPKSYALKIFDPQTGKVTEQIKAKGITLNTKNSETINFNAVCEQARNIADDFEDIFVEHEHFVRILGDDVRIVKRKKQFKAVINKRRRVNQRTYPFGYDPSLILQTD